MNDSSMDKSEIQKAVRLVDYLTRLALMRTKLVREIDEYQNVLWLSSVPHERGCFARTWGRDEEHEPDEWLEIQNRREPELPIVPAQCKDWVDQSALRNKNDLPELLQQITRQVQNPDWREDSDQPETILRSDHLEEHPDIQRAWDRYVETNWLPWTEEHNTWEKVYKVYAALFAIHQEQLRLGEEYELVLGVGLLTWQTPTGQRVRRHLIVADAVLEFEARLGRFVVRPHTEGARLRPELDMLDIEEQPARAEEAAKSSLIGAEDDPWETACIEGVLRALVHSINAQGYYDPSLDVKSIRATPKPLVEYAPALILRKRSAKGLTDVLKRIRERIQRGESIPGEFADLAEIHPKNDRETGDSPRESNGAFDGEVFFPKPSNEEQRRIVDKIRAATGVLVQGPPGTGKSHTIANLVCHLLATGQRTLITAKTPRALQVLEGLVPPELRPLCINLLGSGLEERRSLESSVGGILRKNEEWNEDSAKREKTELEGSLRNLREEKTKVNRRLRDIRESETHSQSIAEGRYRGTAARIAEAVNRDRNMYEWFTDVVPLDKTCQLHANDLQGVLEGLRHFTSEERRELCLVWPEVFPDPEHFAILVQNESKATEEERGSANGADEHVAELLSKGNAIAVEGIRKAFSDFQVRRKNLMTSPHKWMSDALYDVLTGNSSLWHELSRVTRQGIASIEEVVTVADAADIGFSDTANIRTLHEDACKLKDHMENGGKLGWWLFRPKTVKDRLHVIRTVRVGGRPCSTVEHFSALVDGLHVRVECEKAWGFWVGRSERIQGPYALQMTALKSLCVALEDALSIEMLIGACQETMRQCPAVSEPAWSDESEVEKIIASCHLALARHSKRLAIEEIQSIEVPISSIVTMKNAHSVAKELLHAIRSRNVDGFANAVNGIRALEEKRQHLEKMDEYLSRMAQLLPSFTAELKRTCVEPYWNERLQQIGNAWHWAQARYWIEEYIRQEDIPALAKRAKQTEDEINGIIATLASLHSWSFCFSRLKEDHRRHMEAWQQSMRRLGKGTGKHAPRHRREAQQHLNLCREAVPAWVMPLHRVWDTVDPAPGMFDVIIVDEASQCGVEALPLFYLGNKILIVGDDKQISPDAVGLPRDSVHRLMEEFLKDFEFKSSFDVESSLFDHGKLRYGTRRITLREHFRCMPEVIRFSNDLCYSDTPLIPLRQYGPNRLTPLEHVFVSGGYREGSNNRTINRPEANAIVEKIAELCADKRYFGRTMGVVVLQGEAQAGLIEGQLLERLGAQEMERRRLLCGNPYSFQGDERDIMFLSLVAASNERIGPLTKAADERRFNVAASRARDQMYLFHSVTCDDLSVTCLRRSLLEFFEGSRPQEVAGINRDELERKALQDNRKVVKPPSPFDSWFEVDIALELARRDFNVIPQYEIAGKRIDLVIEGGHARLAVECDGDEWHGPERYEGDMQRQRQLERCGWEFFRVRESAFYSNKEDALQGLWRALEERDIFPGDYRFNDKDKHDEDEDVFDEAEQDEEGDDTELNDLAPQIVNTASYSDSNSSKRPDKVSMPEIQDAILQVLSRCPNQSCTIESMTARVLKELGIVTRGHPRAEFEKRVIRSISILEERERVEKYKAKNRRVRMI
jgi:very-short-patch-repair endonuclease